MKALLTIVIVGVLAYFILPNLEKGRIGPLSPPLRVSYRTSLVGKGIVLKIENRSNEILYDLSVKIEAPNGRWTTANVADHLNPTDSTEVGWMELNQWKLEVGEQIFIYAKGYTAPFMTKCTGYEK